MPDTCPLNFPAGGEIEGWGSPANIPGAGNIEKKWR
jgi:hypothetical protein